MRFLVSLLLAFGLVLTAGCASPRPATLVVTGGNGTLNNPVVIRGTPTLDRGFHEAEQAWIAQHYPESSQRGDPIFVTVGARRLDLVDINTQDGKVVRLHFDVTDALRPKQG